MTQPNPMLYSICDECPRGYYSAKGETEKCLACAPGQFSQSASKSCKNCAAAHYAPETSSSHCKYCKDVQNNWYASEEGQTNCKTCGEDDTVDRPISVGNGCAPLRMNDEVKVPTGLRVEIDGEDIEGKTIVVSWDCGENNNNQPKFVLEYKVENGKCNSNFMQAVAQVSHYQCCDTNDWNVENIITNQTRKEYAQCDSESHTLKHTFLLDFPAWCTKIPQVIVWREETIGMSKPATVLGGSDGNLWSHARSCGDQKYLNRSTLIDPQTWNCEHCSEGSSCMGAVMYEEIRPLFGWYKLRNSDADRHQFLKCRFPPACLGAINTAYKDLYTAGGNNTNPALVDNAEGCNMEAGYENFCYPNSDWSDASSGVSSNTTENKQICRLCARCRQNYRRTNNGYGYECNECPNQSANWALLILGSLVVIAMIYVLLSIGMGDVLDGNASEALSRVLINFLQVIAIFATFPLAWPDFIVSMFELQGVVSTVGSFLLNPECELKMSVVDIFYSKMIGECVYEGARERTTCCLVFILPS